MTLTDAALAAELARDAGELLLEVRKQEGFWDPYDLGDAGDTRANTLILDGLARARPDDAVLSEEAVDDLSRVHADRVWIVDPLDGTWEFSTLRNDWAVHIALWQRFATDGPPTLGPNGADSEGGITARGGGTARIRRGLSHATPSPRRPRAPTARCGSPRARAARPRCCGGWPTRWTSSWSASGRQAPRRWRLSRVDVDAYLHAGGQWEWDSAAPAGVLWAAGLHASRLDGSPLIYNRRDPYLPDLLMCRPELAEPLLTAIRSVIRGGPRRTT